MIKKVNMSKDKITVLFMYNLYSYTYKALFSMAVIWQTGIDSMHVQNAKAL